MKKLFLFGEVDCEKIEGLMNEIINAKGLIELYISCIGGEAAVAFGLAIFLKNRGDVRTIAFGECYSAGAIVLMGGSERIAYTSSEIMFHKVKLELELGNAEELKKKVKSLELFSKKYVTFLEERTGKNARFLKNKLKEDWYLTPEEALKEGLVDKIIY